MQLGNPTGVSVLGLLEHDFEGARYISRKGEGFCAVSFSAFPPASVPQKYNYIKDFLGESCAFVSFLDRCAPEVDPRGTYYLDDDFGFGYLTAIDEVVTSESGLSRSETWLLGSSKGATAALLLAVTKGYPKVFINAPQVRIASYIKRRSTPIIDYLTGNDERAFSCLDDVLFRAIGAMDKSLPWDITITCGDKDRYHLRELDMIEASFKTVGVHITRISVSGGHDDSAINEYRTLMRQRVLAPSAELYPTG